MSKTLTDQPVLNPPTNTTPPAEKDSTAADSTRHKGIDSVPHDPIDVHNKPVPAPPLPVGGVYTPPEFGPEPTDFADAGDVDPESTHSAENQGQDGDVLRPDKKHGLNYD